MSAVAIIAFIGTTLGTFGGIVASGKPTRCKLRKLEEKVDKHNFVEGCESQVMQLPS